MKKNIRKIAEQLFELENELLATKEEDLEKRKEIENEIQKIALGISMLGYEAIAEIDSYVFNKLNNTMKKEENANESKSNS